MNLYSESPQWFDDPQRRFDGLPLRVIYRDGRMWTLAGDVSYRMQDGRVSTVRDGFLFDFASIPRFFWRVVGPPTGGGPGANYGVAALFHDWLYKRQRIHSMMVSRKEADGVFLEIMLYTGVRPWRAMVMWLAVRTFGWLYWSKNGPSAWANVEYQYHFG